MKRDVGVEQVLLDPKYQIRLADHLRPRNVEAVSHVLKLGH
jgi:hypothetical protein